ncbi:MAG: hypothetical protein FWG99_05060 [Treponema sp.]|nr:hypothetical protein [Treponema sp.]
MKEKIFIVVVFCIGVFASCKSLNYAQPDFNRPYSHVIDSYSASGGLEDRIRLYNQSSNSGISFKVYVHDPDANTWLEYGTGTLRRQGDTDFISSWLAGNLKKYRYYAIAALDEEEYTYNFYKRNNDLHIVIGDNMPFF